MEGSKVIKFTSTLNNDFVACHLTEKLQKVQRYSYQRGFVEAYHIGQQTNDWMKGNSTLPPFPLEEAESRKLLDCAAPIPDFSLETFEKRVEAGKLEEYKNPKPLFRDRAIAKVDAQYLGYPIENLELLTVDILHNIKTEPISNPGEELKEKEYALFKMKNNYSGFIRVDVNVKEKTTLALTFDEVLTEGKVDYLRLRCSNVVYYELEAGEYELETLEPYTFQYLQVNVLKGKVSVKSAGIRHLRCKDTARVTFGSSDKELELLFNTGLETFRQNAVDIFMDCPSRERAGWLCDSFYTGRAEEVLTGKNLIEKAFLENYAVAEKFNFLPEGMLPMCFPADNYNGNFIPNWSLWFILELEEHLKRTGDSAFVETLRERIFKLLGYFEKLTNEAGLLEDLKGWIFVEWSKANEFVNGVNYPSNMLYASALDTVCRLYKKPEYAVKAENIRKKVLEQYFNGKFFRDNSVREKGVLKPTENYSETCQYFAFFFGVATKDSHPELWKTLTVDFGPERVKNKLFPEIHASNAFIGNLMRMDLLGAQGYIEKQIEEIKKYYLLMARETGTFWENDNRGASLNHGFSSQICHFLVRDIAGITINAPGKTITWKLSNMTERSFNLTLPIGDDSAVFTAELKNNEIRYSFKIPAGYKINIVEHPEVPSKNIEFI